jgi:hypothetical protein
VRAASYLLAWFCVSVPASWLFALVVKARDER